MIGDYGKHTVVLRSLMENEQTKPLLDEALSKYPLFTINKKYDLIPTREELNEKILNHYKYREIGFETIGRFLDELKITMAEIMPYYNEMFKTIVIMADLENPFDNVDIVETFEQTTEGQTNASSNVNSSGSSTSDGSELSKRKFSDTPQNNVANIDNYLTEYSEEDKTTRQTNESESATAGTDSATTTTTNRHTFTKKGNQGVNTFAHDINEYRTSIIDVVDRIIHDNRIAELFMLVW